MQVEKIITISCWLIGLTGCQTTSPRTTSYIIDDPTVIQAYQLPVYPDGVHLLASYKQHREDNTLWYWTELENKTLQSSENLMIQVIADTPLASPPSQFLLHKPTQPAERRYNSIGAYQKWGSIMPGGDLCTYTQQHKKISNRWLSIFIHYCTPETDQNPNWISQLKPSYMIEG